MTLLQETFIVAGVLCLVCSIVVSTAAVGLRPIQERNKKLGFQREVLIALGLFDAETHTKADIPELFKQVEPVLIDLETGQPADTEDVDVDTFNLADVVSNPDLIVDIPSDQDLAGIQTREKYNLVYLLKKEDGSVGQIAMTIRGKGLWSTMWGIMSLDADGTTVRGLSFYDHGETPGLGGEITNPNWRASWSNPECPKQMYDDNGEVAIKFSKSTVTCDTQGSEHKFDALAGATISTRGVELMMHYWFGDNGYKPFLQHFLSGEMKLSSRE